MSGKCLLVGPGESDEPVCGGAVNGDLPCRSGWGEIGRRLGITPIPARVSTPFLTHSSVSPRPRMKFEETRFRPKISTAPSSAVRISGSESPGQTRQRSGIHGLDIIFYLVRTRSEQFG